MKIIDRGATRQVLSFDALIEAIARPQAGQRKEGAQVRTVFKSVGTALEDLAAAVLVVEGQRGN